MESNIVRISMRICSSSTFIQYIYVNGIFPFVHKIFLRNYADDTALYSLEKTISLRNLFLRKTLLIYQKPFYDNYMVLNPGQCYYVTLFFKTIKNKFLFEDSTILPLLKSMQYKE